MRTCDRCGRETLASTGSYFTTEQICATCAGLEREHPAYDEARVAELAAVRVGNFNFPGVGLPVGYLEWARRRLAEREARQTSL